MREKGLDSGAGRAPHFMLTAEEQIQQTVASIDTGRLAKWIWGCVFAAVAVGLGAYYLIHVFRGLPIAQAMDEAQIGREILRGNGFATKFARPLAIGELRRHNKDVSTAIWQDTYNAPIPPLLDAAAISIPIKEGWKIDREHPIFPEDRAIAIMGVFFFLASLAVLYLIAVELFDHRLACIAVGLVLISDSMWLYAISGLPQMFLLFVLHLNVYAILRAMRARYSNEQQLGWLAAAGLGFGVMALTHALSIFIFAPVLVFSFFFFRPRGLGGLLMLGLFLAVYVPLLVRNYHVCGDIRGIAGMDGLDGIVHSESGHMRRLEVDIQGVSGNYFGQNFRVNLMAQIDRFIEFMAWSFVAPLALVSLLHAFRRPVTAVFRGLMFAMFASAVCGMAIFGMKEERGLCSNQFYLLFVPLFVCYGMAYVLVQWDRRIGLAFIMPQWRDRSRTHHVLRTTLVTVIFLVTGIPLLCRMGLDRMTSSIEYPPYFPPAIRLFNQWFQPNEIIASDMPWAVAWYGDRRSIWLPFDVQTLIDLSDYQRLGGPIAALYFTPVSGTQNTLGDLVNGEYRHWTAYIVRTVNLSKSPYPVKVVLGTPDCAVYMDHARQLTAPR